MSRWELINYIIRHHDSYFLLPLAKQYETKVWNEAMREAWRRMGLTSRHKPQPCRYLEHHKDSLVVPVPAAATGEVSN